VVVAEISEAGALQIDDVLTSDGAGTSDFDGPVTAPSFTADPSASPSVLLVDSHANAGEAQILLDGDAAGPDSLLDLQVDIAGTLTSFVQLDGITERIDLLKPLTLTAEAAPTTDADGELSLDTDGWGTGFDAIELFNGTASAYVVATTASDVPTNGQVPKWNTGGSITWEDDSASGGTDATNQRVSMLNVSLGYDTTGSVYPEPAGVTFGVTNFPRIIVQTFNDTSTRDCMWGQFSVPTDYSANSSIVVVWSSLATSGNVDWEFDYAYVTANDTNSLDASASSLTAAGVDAAPGATERRMEFDLGSPSTGIAADATMLWGLCRDGLEAGPTDTLADQVHVYDVLFEYDSTLNE